MESSSDEVLHEFDVIWATGHGKRAGKQELQLLSYSGIRHPLQAPDVQVRVKASHRTFELRTGFDGRVSMDHTKRTQYGNEAVELEHILIDEPHITNTVHEKASVHKLLARMRKKNRKDIISLNNVMHQQVFTSSELPKTIIPYAVGSLNRKADGGGEIRLYPVKALHELRTDFSYIDQASSSVRLDNILHPANEDIDDLEKRGKRIELRYENMQERNKMFEEFEKFKEPQDQELWYPLRLQQGHLPSQVNDQKITNSLKNINKDWYTQYMIEGEAKKQSNLSVKDRLKRLLMQAKIISFAAAAKSLASYCDEAQLLDLLPQFALLLQGNWVIKSEILYCPKLDPINTKLSVAFDHVCLAFIQNTTVRRNEILQRFHIPFDLLLKMLQDIAEFDEDARVWCLQYPIDEQFLTNHADIARTQKVLWDLKNIQLQKRLASKVKKETSTLVPKKSKAVSTKEIQEEPKVHRTFTRTTRAAAVPRSNVKDEKDKRTKNSPLSKISPRRTSRSPAFKSKPSKK